MRQVLLIVDRPEAVIQPGQPPAQMAAWLLDVPDDGLSPLDAVRDFASESGFPLGTLARVIDLYEHPEAVETYELEASWVVAHPGS